MTNKPNPAQCPHCGRSHGRALWLSEKGYDYVETKSRNATQNAVHVEPGKSEMAATVDGISAKDA